MSKFATVDAYVDAQSDPMKEVARALVASIDGASLGSRAVWYGHPVWSLGPQPADGPVVYIKAYTRHVTLGFWNVDAIIDERRIKVGGNNMGSVKVAEAAAVQALPVATWIALVRRAVTEARTP